MGSGNPLQFSVHSSTSDITNDLDDINDKNFEDQYSLDIAIVMHYTYIVTLFTRMEHHHLWGVHYLEFTCIFNYEAPDDFR